MHGDHRVGFDFQGGFVGKCVPEGAVWFVLLSMGAYAFAVGAGDGAGGEGPVGGDFRGDDGVAGRVMGHEVDAFGFGFGIGSLSFCCM